MPVVRLWSESHPTHALYRLSSLRRWSVNSSSSPVNECATFHQFRQLSFSLLRSLDLRHSYFMNIVYPFLSLIAFPPTLLSNTLSYRFPVIIGLMIISFDALEVLVIGPVFLVYYTHKVSPSDWSARQTGPFLFLLYPHPGSSARNNR